MTHSAVFTDPTDQSVWTYHRWAVARRGGLTLHTLCTHIHTQHSHCSFTLFILDIHTHTHCSYSTFHASTLTHLHSFTIYVSGNAELDIRYSLHSFFDLLLKKTTFTLFLPLGHKISFHILLSFPFLSFSLLWI